MEEKNELKCDMLFSDNIKDSDYDEVYTPFTTGIATFYDNNIKKYLVYNNNENGCRTIEKEFDNFESALEYAIIIWDGMKAYYRGLFMIYDRLQENDANVLQRGLRC